MVKAEKISYTLGERTIFDGLSFAIEKGEKVALVGPNGAGKSTLIKMLLKTIRPDDGSFFLAKDVNIGYMPQSLEELGDLPNMTVQDFMFSGRGLDIISKKLAETLERMNQPGLTAQESEKLAAEYSELLDEFMHKDGFQAESELLDILIGFNLDCFDLDQNIDSLSGGQKTKLALARVLFARPDFIILDEPTNHLDDLSVVWVLEFLSGFKGSLLIVSHEPSVLDAIVAKVVYLDGGGSSQSFKGNLSDFNKKKAALEKAAKKLYERQLKEKQQLEEFIDRWRSQKPTLVQDREKKLQRLIDSMVTPPDSQKNISLDFKLNQKPSEKVVEAIGVAKSYDGAQVLDNVSFTLYRGEKMAIIGPNGTGKTTLLRMIAGYVKSDGGQLNIGDKVELGYYAQEHELLEDANTVLEELAAARPDLNQGALRSILAHFLFPGNRVFTQVKSLSLGEKSRLALAKMVAAGHNFLVLDEPTNHLDFISREKIKEALKTYAGTILIISHDREFIKSIGVERVLKLPENEVGLLRRFS